ncbi:MAG: phospholipase D family protein [Pseudoxanthomonas sp.]
MSFVFQQPGSAGLLQALNTAAVGASKGGGMFAFASRLGIERLLKTPSIAQMLGDRRPFHLVVGIDAITNADALLYLEEMLHEHQNCLTAHAFLHDHPGTFHPKFCWFQKPDCLDLITGSGNLTVSGLGQDYDGPLAPGNWEAFVVQALHDQAGINTAETIERWIDTNVQQRNLRAIDDPDVRDQAMVNSRVRYTKPRPAQVVGRPASPAAAAIVLPQDVLMPQMEHDVLIRELPKNRLGQADIGRQGLAFLGFTGTPTTIFLQHVELDDSVGPVTEQRLFVNASQNYRLELNAIAHHGYKVDANDNRMILVAVKLNDRSFRYTVVPVTNPSYAMVSGLLGQIQHRSGARAMRLRVTTTQELRSAWLDAPENLLPILIPAIET